MRSRGRLGVVDGEINRTQESEVIQCGTDVRQTVSRAIGFGVSQSGRFLRDFLYLGFNEDTQGRVVFDDVPSALTEDVARELYGLEAGDVMAAKLRQTVTV